MTNTDQRPASEPALARERASRAPPERGWEIAQVCRSWPIICALLSACVAPEPTRVPASPIPVYVPTERAVRAEPAVVHLATPPAQLLAPAPALPELTAPQARLAEGIALYDRGDFRGALIKLTKSPELAESVAPPSVRIAALKYAAFSYCVTNQRALCRRQFDALLAIDSSYELTPTEARHRAWGPTFRQAKAKRTAAPAKQK